nr:unnamed protein product [Spirometra erinaceieuropaei]
MFAPEEDIRQGHLLLFLLIPLHLPLILLLLLLLLLLRPLLLLHRYLNSREDGVDLFFECHHLMQFDDDQSVIHIACTELRSVMSENQRLQPL